MRKCSELGNEPLSASGFESILNLDTGTRISRVILTGHLADHLARLHHVWVFLNETGITAVLSGWRSPDVIGHVIRIRADPHSLRTTRSWRVGFCEGRPLPQPDYREEFLPPSAIAKG